MRWLVILGVALPISGWAILQDILYIVEPGSTNYLSGMVISMRDSGTHTFSALEQGTGQTDSGVKFNVVTLDVDDAEFTQYVTDHGRTARYISETAEGPKQFYLHVDDVVSPTKVTQSSRTAP